MSEPANAASLESTSRREPTDADVVRTILDWKLATQQELKTALANRKDRGADASLLDFLTSENVLTAKQLIRVRQDLALADKPTQQIPGYQLLERIGSGGMGVVYKARQLRMDRLVAIKLMRSKVSQDARYVERFLREAKLAARLSHNHIVQAIDAGDAYGHPYFVMEYVEGASAGHLLRTKGPFEEAEAVRIVWQVAQALEHAQKRSMVHRDIKPENIMLTNEGVAKLADLGLARMTEDATVDAEERGLIVGTVFYVSPEQIRGDREIDSRADIYSLGATLYAMVAGKPPFTGERAREVLLQHLEATPTPLNRVRPDVSDGLSFVVETMLAKSRQDRYASPSELVFDLQCLIAGQSPRLALERVSLRTLAELADGEAVEERGIVPRRGRATKNTPQSAGSLTIVLVGLLSLSVLINLLLVFFKI